MSEWETDFYPDHEVPSKMPESPAVLTLREAIDLGRAYLERSRH